MHQPQVCRGRLSCTSAAVIPFKGGGWFFGYKGLVPSDRGAASAQLFLSLVTSYNLFALITSKLVDLTAWHNHLAATAPSWTWRGGNMVRCVHPQIYLVSNDG